jgi:hypothetical protein
VVGALFPGVLGAAVTTLAASATPADAATWASSTDASALYQQALTTTRAWSVHYASSSTESSSAQSGSSSTSGASSSSPKTLLENGDAGPASGSQTVLEGGGTISIVVIGGLSYVKGNAGGLETLVGLDSSQAAEAAGHWIEFSTGNAAFAQVVAGVRSKDIAQELALKGPLTLGHTRDIDGVQVQTIKGTQKFGKTTQHVVLYVRAHGTHVPVEEDSVDSKGRRTDAEHIAYSKWGEQVRPKAPPAAVSIGPVSSV